MPVTTLFVDRFRAVVMEHRDRVAVEGGAGRLTYGDLYDRAVAVAHLLKKQGAGRETVVGLGLEKSVEYVAALLGTWQAGAAFLPLDPSLPRERLEFLVRDSGAALILARAGDRDRFAGLPAGFLELPAVSGSAESPSSVPGERVLYRGHAEDLAYIIYTSGSTGAPKGVMVSHVGIVNVLEAQIPAFGLKPGSRSLWYLSSSFDASVSDLGTALLSGATLYIDPGTGYQTPAGLLDLLRRRRITHLDLPPALLGLLNPEAAPECLETIIIGGEPCPPEVVRRWASRVRVINVYGPTEATVCTSLCLCDAGWDRPILGTPIANIRYRLLDANQKPAPPGTAAELYIGGIGLARGYRGRPDLDVERLIPRDGERLYRTGDRVMQHPDGAIEFLGRLDRQIKVRGMLVTPEEIEAALARHPEVMRAAVLQRPMEGTREALVAFYEAREGSRISSAALRRHLAGSLPRWMLPQRFVLLDHLPLTGTGKIDLAELARRPLGSMTLSPEATPPETVEETLLVEVWRQALGRPAGVTDDFFEMGGDSLGVLEVVAAAESRGLPLTVPLMIRCPTIRGILAEMEQATTHDGVMSSQELRKDVEAGAEWEPILRKARSRPGGSPRRNRPGTILVTGATGFLGSRLVVELLRRTEAALYCLVRAAEPEEGRRRCLEAIEAHGQLCARESERIIAVCGDISAPRLGVSQDVWHDLASSIDSVYHCAAQVNVALPYEALREANVGGTREILRFLCEGQRKWLHYASTLSVFVATDRNTGRMEEEDDLERTGEVYGGYAQTKWAAEWLLRQTRGDAGPVGFYRLGLITGDTDTGRATGSDLLSLFFRGIASLGCVCVPEDLGPGLQVDITPVDYAAAAMAHLSLAAANEEGFSTFHIANPRAASLADLLEALRAECVPVSEVSGPEWQRCLREHLEAGADGDVSAAYLSLCRVLPIKTGFQRQRTNDLFQATGATFGMENTLAGLHGSDLSCPSASRELLRKYVRCALSGRNPVRVPGQAR